MGKWLTVLAIILALASLVTIWVVNKQINERLVLLEHGKISLEQKLSSTQETVDKLASAARSVEQEADVLEKNPYFLIDVVDAQSVEKGVFSIQTRFNKVQIRNKSRFNVRELEIHISYLDANSKETGTNATGYAHDLVVAGEAKWCDLEGTPWVGGRPGARMYVTKAQVIGK